MVLYLGYVSSKEDEGWKNEHRARSDPFHHWRFFLLWFSHHGLWWASARCSEAMKQGSGACFFATCFFMHLHVRVSSVFAPGVVRTAWDFQSKPLFLQRLALKAPCCSMQSWLRWNWKAGTFRASFGKEKERHLSQLASGVETLQNKRNFDYGIWQLAIFTTTHITKTKENIKWPFTL